MTDIIELIEFIRFTHLIRNVRRAMVFEDQVHENDEEHQYQLALVCWFLLDNDKLSLDKYRVIGMAMVHDVIEVHAGDTIAFASKDVISGQAEKERAAIDKLKAQWPTFISLHALIDEYEKCASHEAKFVYSMDKLLPIINNYLYEGKAWKEHQVSFEKMKSIKVGKIDKSSEVNEYYEQLLRKLEAKPDLFGWKQ